MNLVRRQPSNFLPSFLDEMFANDRVYTPDFQSRQLPAVNIRETEQAFVLELAVPGLKKEDLLSHKFVLPAVRFAVDAYINFARRSPWKEAAMSSLTEMFAPQIHQQRLDTWPKNYPWIEQNGLRYFQKRIENVNKNI